MSTPLSPEQLESLRSLDACTLANAIETFHKRLRNEGYMDASVRCLFPKLPPVIGHAVTVKIRGSEPPMSGREFLDRTDWWDYIVSLPAPRFVVIQDTASRIGAGSLIGAVHMNILRALQCTAVVTNGSVRDIPAAEQAGFQLFAGSVCVSHAYVHIVEFGGAVEVGGLTVKSGDLLHGDLHGVQSIPAEIAAEIFDVAVELNAQKDRLISLCQSGDFSIQKLRATMAGHQP